MMFKFFKKSILLLMLSSIFAISLPNKFELTLIVWAIAKLTNIPIENFETDPIDKKFIYKDERSKKLEKLRKKTIANLKFYEDEVWMEYHKNDCVELKKFCNKQPSSNFTPLNKNDDNCCYCYY